MSRDMMGEEEGNIGYSVISRIATIAKSFLRSLGEEKESSEFCLISKISNLTESFLTLEEHRQQLLPGILDEITLEHISTKLPYSAVRVLSLVSRSWKHAIRKRQVHNARVHSNSAETLVLVCSQTLGKEDYCEDWKLVSARDKSFCHLAPFPRLEGFLEYPEFIALDGKIYAIGGWDWQGQTSSKVFALDVAGQRQWKKCATMLEGRADFGYGVFNGKIYVFGGSYEHTPVFGSEVYDPKTNVWSRITPMSTLRSFHHVVVVGDELLVHGGEVQDGAYFRNDPDWIDKQHWPDPQPAEFCEFYNPVTNSWRTGARDVSYAWVGKKFTANGKVFSMENDGLTVSVHNFDTESWVYSQTSVFPSNIAVDSFVRSRVSHVNGELVTIGRERTGGSESSVCFLLKSSGFGTDREIIWEQILEEHIAPDIALLIQL